MKLKVRFLDWSAGIPVAMLNRATAGSMSIHTQDRISIKSDSKEIDTIVDIVGSLVGKNEIGVSSEIRHRLKLRKGQFVDVNLEIPPKSLDFIKEKLHGKTLSREKIHNIISGVVDNSLSDSEIALFVSSMYKYGLNFKETVCLIEAILKTGNKLNINRKFVVDKHSVGGIAGNRTTPIVVSICAAAGLTMPKTSSRAITSPAGTADVVETIAKVDFSMKELKKIIQKTNACMVWGGGLGMVPADSKIIQVEKMLKLESESQLLASIMSKKLSSGAKYVVIDIPYGKTAKVNLEKAKKLKKKFERLAKHFKVKMRVLLIEAKEPMGSGVGPALELRDVIAVLNPKENGPKDLEEKSTTLAGELLEMTGKAEKNSGKELAREILYSGKAFEKFQQIIKAQEGKLKKIIPAKYERNILARRNLTIKEIDNKKINSLARIAGCPLDKFAGLYIYHNVGEKVKKGERLMTIYSESKNRLKDAFSYYQKEKPIRAK